MLKEINLHPSSDMLLKYSMGNTTEAESLIISCHIAYCAECKEELKKYETIGGYYLSNHKELSVSKDLWKNILVKVDGLDQEEFQANYTSHSIKSSLSHSDIKVPSTLSEYLGSNFDTKNWKSSINNIKYKDIKFQDRNISGKLLEIPANKSMPKHGHEALEATLVLHGGYSDEKGDYNKGDLVVASSNEVHSPVSAASGCICLVVYSGSLQFKGLLGSILNLTKF
jgi:putative transcriptional regulator